MYPDLNMRHERPVENVIVCLLIKLKGNSKCISSNSLSQLRVLNKDIGRRCGGDFTNQGL